MIKEYFTASKVTTTNAFELFERLARDQKNSEPICVYSKSFREISIIYHAAKHHGFTITHFNIGDNKYPIKNGIIRIAEEEWYFFIYGADIIYISPEDETYI